MARRRLLVGGIDALTPNPVAERLVRRMFPAGSQQADRPDHLLEDRVELACPADVDPVRESAEARLLETAAPPEERGTGHAGLSTQPRHGLTFSRSTKRRSSVTDGAGRGAGHDRLGRPTALRRGAQEPRSLLVVVAPGQTPRIGPPCMRALLEGHATQSHRREERWLLMVGKHGSTVRDGAASLVPVPSDVAEYGQGRLLALVRGSGVREVQLP
jgi:hypothetical protein